MNIHPFAGNLCGWFRYIADSWSDPITVAIILSSSTTSSLTSSKASSSAASSLSCISSYLIMLKTKVQIRDALKKNVQPKKCYFIIKKSFSGVTHPVQPKSYLLEIYF